MGRKKTMHDKKKHGDKHRSSLSGHHRPSGGGDAAQKALPLCVVASAAFWNALSEEDVPVTLDVDFETTPPASASGTVASTAVPELLQWFAKGVAASDAAAAARLEFAASLAKDERAAVHTAISTAGLGAVLESCSEGVGEQRRLTVFKKGHAPAKPAATPELLERAATLYKWARDSGLTSYSRDEIAEQLAASPDGAGLAPPLAALWAARSAEQTDVAALAKLVEADDAAGVTALLKTKPGLAGAVDSSTGQPPLHTAARLGAAAALRALVAAGAKLEEKDAHGRTALAVARTFEQCDVEAALLQLGAHDPEAGRFPFNKAAAELTSKAVAAAAAVSKPAVTAAPAPASLAPGLVEEAVVAQMVSAITSRLAAAAEAGPKSAASAAPAPKPAAPAAATLTTADAAAVKQLVQAITIRVAAEAAAPQPAPAAAAAAEAFVAQMVHTITSRVAAAAGAGPKPAAPDPKPRTAVAATLPAADSVAVKQMVHAIISKVAAAAGPQLAPAASTSAAEEEAVVAQMMSAITSRVAAAAAAGPKPAATAAPDPRPAAPAAATLTAADAAAVKQIVQDITTRVAAAAAAPKPAQVAAASKPEKAASGAALKPAPAVTAPAADEDLVVTQMVHAIASRVVAAAAAPKPAAVEAPKPAEAGAPDFFDAVKVAPAIKAPPAAVAAAAAVAVSAADAPSAPATPSVAATGPISATTSANFSGTVAAAAAATTAAGPAPGATDLVAQARKIVDEGRAWVAEHAGFALYAGATTLAAGITMVALSIAHRR